MREGTGKSAAAQAQRWLLAPTHPAVILGWSDHKAKRGNGDDTMETEEKRAKRGEGRERKRRKEETGSQGGRRITLVSPLFLSLSLSLSPLFVEGDNE